MVRKHYGSTDWETRSRTLIPIQFPFNSHLFQEVFSNYINTIKNLFQDRKLKVHEIKNKPDAGEDKPQTSLY